MVTDEYKLVRSCPNSKRSTVWVATGIRTLWAARFQATTTANLTGTIPKVHLIKGFGAGIRPVDLKHHFDVRFSKQSLFYRAPGKPPLSLACSTYHYCMTNEQKERLWELNCMRIRLDENSNPTEGLNEYQELELAFLEEIEREEIRTIAGYMDKDCLKYLTADRS